MFKSYFASLGKCLWWGISGMGFYNFVVPLYPKLLAWHNIETVIDKFWFAIGSGALFQLVIIIFYYLNKTIDETIDWIILPKGEE